MTYMLSINYSNPRIAFLKSIPPWTRDQLDNWERQSRFVLLFTYFDIKGHLLISLYNKSDDFNLNITKFPYLK